MIVELCGQPAVSYRPAPGPSLQGQWSGRQPRLSLLPASRLQPGQRPGGGRLQPRHEAQVPDPVLWGRHRLEGRPDHGQRRQQLRPLQPGGGVQTKH